MTYDGSIRIDTKLDTKKAKSGLDGLFGSIKKLGKLVASVFAIGAIISFTRASVQAYSVQTQAEQKLTTVLKNRFGATQDVIKSVKDLTAAEQAAGVIGDEIQMEGLKTLSAFVGSLDDVKDLAGSMNDLIAFKFGFNVTTEGASTIAKAMGDAVQRGVTEPLKEMGIAVDAETQQMFALASQSERVAMLQKIIQDRVGGTNAALANTPYGRIVQLQNAWGDFKEQIGEAASNIGAIFVPALTKALSMLSEMAARLIDISKALQEVFLGSSSNAALIKTAEDAAKSEEKVAESVEEVGEAIAGNLASFDELNVMQSATASETETDTSFGGVDAGQAEEISPSLISSAEKLKNLLEPIISLLKELCTDTGGALKELNTAVLVPLFDLLTEMLLWVTGSLQTIYDKGIKPLASAIGKYILPPLKELIGVVKEIFVALEPIAEYLINNILPAIDRAGTVLLSFAGGALNKIVSLLKIAASAFGDFSASLDGTADTGDIFGNLIDGIASGLSEIIETVSEWVAEHGVEIIETGKNILSALLEGITKNLPRLINAATSIIRKLLAGISKALPKILKAAVEIIKTLVQGLLSNESLSVLLNGVIEVINSLIGFILDSLPLLIEAAVQIIMSLCEFLTDADNLEMIVDAALTIIVTLAEGLLDFIPQLIEAVIQIILSLFNALTDPANLQKIVEAGLRIISALIKGLINSIPKLLAAIPKIISAIWDAFTSVNWLELGKNILEGIGDGIKSAVKSVANAAKDACKSVWNGIKDFFGIHSPSALMRDTVGVYVAEGIGVGFAEEMDAVGADMEKALSQSMDFAGAAEALKGNVSVGVEGMTLPKFDIGGVLPYNVIYDFTQAQDNAFEGIREAVEDMADDVRAIKNKTDEGKGEITVQIVDTSGKVKAQTTVELAERENRKAGKTVIPIG